MSLDRLDLRAWSDGRVKPAVSRAGRQARVDGGHLDDGRAWRCRSRLCQPSVLRGSAVVRRPASLSGHGARWRGAGRRGRAAAQGNRVDGQRNRSRPAVRGRAFSCPWPVRVSRDPWVHGRTADGGVPVSRLAAYMCWSAACCSGGRRAVRKTVGSAYVGSNPTPATTCENGPLAAETRPGGPFPSCHQRKRESVKRFGRVS